MRMQGGRDGRNAGVIQGLEDPAGASALLAEVPGSRVPLSDPVREYRELEREIDEALKRVLRSGTYILGETVEAFETAFAERVGVGFAVGVASGTDALALALQALGIGAGDEVVTSPFTFVATATAILATGATPVFADVLPDTFNLDLGAVDARITDRTAAIVPVHLFGQMADMVALEDVAAAHGLAIVEDAAQAFGATQAFGAPRSSGTGETRCAGTVGVAGCFSFYPTKSLGAAGDGGMITTDDSGLAARLRRLRNQGRRPTGEYAEIGHNSRLDAVQAAILHAKLGRVDAWAEQRRGHAFAYDVALAEGPGIRPPVTAEGNRHSFHQYTVLCHGRARVAAAFEKADIASAIFYDTPLHRLEALASLGVPEGSLPVAEELAGRVLSIPVFAHLAAPERARIVDVLAASGTLHPG